MAKSGFTITWSADQTTSDVVDLGDRGHTFINVNNEAAAQVYFEASTDNSKWAVVRREDDGVQGVSSTTFILATSTSGRWVPADFLRSYRYLRAVATATAAGNSLYLSTVY